MSEQNFDAAFVSADRPTPRAMVLAMKAMTGVIAILVAIKASNADPSAASGYVLFDHVFKMIAFLSLTVWIAFTIGVRRYGNAAMLALIFAVMAEMIIGNRVGVGLGTLVSANLGIVLAYCGLQLYVRAGEDSATV